MIKLLVATFYIPLLLLLFLNYGVNANTKKKEDAIQLFLKGRREYSQYKNYHKAESYFVQSLHLDDSNPDVHMGLGMISIKRNDPATAYYHFNEVTKLDPRNEVAAQNSFTSLNVRIPRHTRTTRPSHLPHFFDAGYGKCLLAKRSN